MDNKTLFRQVASSLMRDIRDNQLEIGSRLAPTRKLAEQYNTSYVTIQKALKILEDEAIIQIRHGSGCYLLRLPELEQYRKNSNLANNRRIGVLLPVWVNQGGKRAVYEMLDGFTTRCSEHNWRIELISPSISEINSPTLTSRILNERFDGFAWFAPLAQHQWILEHLSHEIDCLVVTERPFEKIGINTIHPDYYQLAQDAVKLFVERGHKEVFCFCGQYFDVWADPYTEMIIEMLSRACAEAGLRFDRDCYRQVYPMPDEEAEVIIRDVFEKRPEINAVFCMYNSRLETIIREMRKHRQNLSDSDITIIDNCYKSAMTYQSHIDNIGIYRVRYPNYKIGEAMATVFEKRWEGTTSEPVVLCNEIVAPGELF